MKRDIIKIDEKKCNGCGLCIPNCPEGAIQIIDNKAKLVSDIMCDGIGACLGHCPMGAISIEKRETEPYDERKVMINIVKHGTNTIQAHLVHLNNHGETKLLKEAVEYLKENNIAIPSLEIGSSSDHIGNVCPGSRSSVFHKETSPIGRENNVQSELNHWPIQLHLISPESSHFKGADMVLAADCTAFSFGDFHGKFLKGKTLAIACPKLDNSKEIYQEKIIKLINDAKINTLTVIIMQVPCCGGLLQIARNAVLNASRNIPVKSVVISLQGDTISEEWL